MKPFFAYALIVIGLPNLAGMAVGFPITALFSYVIPPDKKMKLYALVDLFNGLGCMCAGVLIFRLFGLNPMVAVPIISAVWFLAYAIPKQHFAEGFCYSIGVFGGWLSYLKLFAA